MRTEKGGYARCKHGTEDNTYTDQPDYQLCSKFISWIGMKETWNT